MKVKQIGVYLEKNVVELHGVDKKEKVVFRKTLRRDKVLSTFARLPACVVAMKFCVINYYWQAS